MTVFAVSFPTIFSVSPAFSLSTHSWLPASATTAAAATPTFPPLPPTEALSTLLGSISLTCWVFLILPQIWENYRNRSASAVSLPFLLLWSAGDVCNLVGAIWAGVVVNTVIAVGIYWCVTDSIVVAQWLFYHALDERNKRRGMGREEKEAEEGRGQRTPGTVLGEQDGADDDNETQPLLAGQQRSQRRSSTTEDAIAQSAAPTIIDDSQQLSERAPQHHPEMAYDDDNDRRRKTWLSNSLSILAVVVIGTAGWAIAWYLGTWDGGSGNASTVGSDGFGDNFSLPATQPPYQHQPPDQGHHLPHGSDVATAKTSSGTPLGAEFLGYLSALAYLSARIPQIIKNARSRSCEGLSLLFFLLSLLGNLTYGFSIVAHSLDPAYLLANTPWLIGSLGTVVQDCIVFWQFWTYSRPAAAAAAAADDRNSQEVQGEAEPGAGAEIDTRQI